MPRVSLPTLAGGIPVPRVTSQLCFLPQGPTWGSKDKCFTKMYTTSGECCKACNLGEGVVQPCGVNQTVCEPCLDSEYLLPTHQGCWAQGGLWGPPAGAGVLPVHIPLESCVDALRAARCSLPVPNSCTNAPKWQDFFQDFPPILQPSAQQIPTPDPTTALFQDLLVPGMFAGPLPGLCPPAPPQHCPPKLTHTAVTQRATCTIANFTL